MNRPRINTKYLGRYTFSFIGRFVNRPYNGYTIYLHKSEDSPWESSLLL